MSSEQRMSTHRVIQIASLGDDLSSRARVARRALANAVRIGNTNAAAYFLRRAVRFERTAARCAARLEVAA